MNRVGDPHGRFLGGNERSLSGREDGAHVSILDMLRGLRKGEVGVEGMAEEGATAARAEKVGPSDEREDDVS